MISTRGASTIDRPSPGQAPPPLGLDQIVRFGRTFTDADIDRLNRDLHAAAPFPHLVIDGLFDEHLLAAVVAEFPETEALGKATINAEENYRRSPPFPALGPAAAAYFNLANSCAMVQFLARVSGIDGLIVDASLEYGGLHATGPGGKFGIHRDFSHSHTLWLRNRLVMITYLNPDWAEDYNGNLELWDFDRRAVSKSILPVFGRTVIMVHGKRSFHGHPLPLTLPPGRCRRSLATYYYTNDASGMGTDLAHNSVMLRHVADEAALGSNLRMYAASTGWSGKLLFIARQVCPPLIWPMVDRMQHRIKQRLRKRLR